MRLPGGPARFLKTQIVIAVTVAAALASASLTGFVWADREITVVVDGESRTLITKAADVSSLLEEAGVVVSSQDLVSPALDSELGDGETVVIRRSVPVTIKLGDDVVRLRVLGRTVSDAILVAGLDPTAGIHTSPSLESRLYDGMVISATEVYRRVVEREEDLPFETVLSGDPNLPEGVRRVVKKGSPGRSLSIYEVLMVGGAPGRQTLKARKVLSPASDEIVRVGTKTAAVKVAERPSRVAAAPSKAGQTISVKSTAYTPWDAGCIGHTVLRKGYAWVAGKQSRYDIPKGWGIVATDPQVIKTGTKVYVPGYGYAIACDTGGAIKGRKIDVCFWGSSLGAPAASAGGQAQVKQAMAAAHAWGSSHSGRSISVTILGR